MKRITHTAESCPYCHGQGYFQLLLGGTEDCPNCDGAGLNPPSAEVASAQS